MAGFVGDVGDLSKLIMANSGLRAGEDVQAKLAHELSDCLWSVVVIADALNIDLDTTFKDNMMVLKNRVASEK